MNKTSLFVEGFKFPSFFFPQLICFKHKVKKSQYVNQLFYYTLLITVSLLIIVYNSVCKPMACVVPKVAHTTILMALKKIEFFKHYIDKIHFTFRYNK